MIASRRSQASEREEVEGAPTERGQRELDTHAVRTCGARLEPMR
jgi:hypothetical protein